MFGGSLLLKASGAGDALWTPSQIATALWLDAGDPSTIASVSGAVSQWNDKSGNSRNFAATGTARPTLTANGLNSLPVLTFGGGQRLVSQSASSIWKFLHDGTPYLIAGVAKLANSSDPNAIYALAGNSGGSSSLVGCLFGFDDRTAASRNNAFLSWISTSSGYSVLSTTNNFFTPNQPQIWAASLAPSASPAADRVSVVANGGTEIKNNSSTITASQSNPAFNLQIGDSGESSFPMVGYHAEIIIALAPSLPVRQLTEGYLAHKWGLVANLPSGHPYKNAAPVVAP